MKHLARSMSLSFLMASSLAWAEGTAVKHDNTARNKHEAGAVKPTADQQSNSKDDLEITRKIRADVVANKSLSTYAQNVKIITRGGQVTLRGPVRSDEEKMAVDRIARAVAGSTSVQNELTIAK